MNIYEFIGIIIGDGSILYNKEKKYYRLEIAGNVTEEKNYFEKISRFMINEFNITPKKRVITTGLGRCRRLYVDNKKFVEFLINELGLSYGSKTYSVTIPERYVDWKYSKHVLRGIFDTDGCFFFSKSKVFKYPTYPRVQIKSASENLVSQITQILKDQNYKIRVTGPEKEKKTYTMYLSGEEMFERWIKEVGSSNMKNIIKYKFWKKTGYHIPHLTLKERKEILGVHGQAVRQSPAER
tara:strand:- start:1492 stop:2208 length:717 start_codon:yes stop_codon:yes gene_type:complete